MALAHSGVFSGPTPLSRATLPPGVLLRDILILAIIQSPLPAGKPPAASRQTGASRALERRWREEKKLVASANEERSFEIQPISPAACPVAILSRKEKGTDGGAAEGRGAIKSYSKLWRPEVNYRKDPAVQQSYRRERHQTAAGTGVKAASGHFAA